MVRKGGMEFDSVSSLSHVGLIWTRDGLVGDYLVVGR